MNQWVIGLWRAPVRTFVLCPLGVLAWELGIRSDPLQVQPLYLAVMLWGYLQFRLCGLYRTRLGGGGPGFTVPPERLVTSGPYAWTRNPMYLGHVVFLVGLTLALRSALAGLLTVATGVGFHRAVLRDEQRLVDLFGQPYGDYMTRVRRWIPGLL